MTVLPKPIIVNVDTTICYGATLEWAGEEYSTSQTNVSYSIPFAAYACDSVVGTLNLTVLPAVVPAPADIETICAGDAYTWAVTGLPYTVAGIYNDTVRNALGCDSIIYTLDLTVLPPVVTVPDSATICAGDAYTWAVTGLPYTVAGVYNDTVRNTLGCDSIINTLTLTVLPAAATTTESATICAGDAYTWAVTGLSYTVAGVYTDTLVNALGCDSIISTLNLTVLPEVEATVVKDTVCPGETYTWNGETYDKAGTYTITLTNAAGCDSVATLELFIPDADNYIDYDHVPAVSKYGNRLLVINLNAVDSIFGWTPAESDVQWFKVVGAVDKATDALERKGDDEFVGTGYYYTFFDGSSLPDDYYALMLHAMSSGECEEILRTTVLSSSISASAPRLVPTVARPDNTLHVLNLNPSAVSEIRVYTAAGELMNTYTSSQATDFMFKAATMPGYYMVEVKSEGEKVTLRYIVK